METEKSNQYSDRQRLGPHCILDKASIFVGLTSLPIGRESEFRKRLKGMFEEHRKKVSRHFSPESKESFKDFFLPQFYYTFSSFDLAVLSLINDFEFPTQTFHPYHPLWPDHIDKSQISINKQENQTSDKISSFYHQVNIGLVPRFSPGELSEAVNLAKNTFLKDQPLPLIAICQLKLNNEPLIGTGTDFLRCVIRGLRLHFEEENPKKDGIRQKNLQIIILRSITWSELTLILFSTSYDMIARSLLKIRSMKVGDLAQILKGADKRDPLEGNLENWECLAQLFMKRIRNATGIESVLEEFSDTPVFMNSTTTMGFRFELFEEGIHAQNIKPIDEQDKIYPFCRFLAEPAHLGNAIKKTVGKPLNECSDDILLCAGRGDFVYPLWKSEHFEIPISTKEFIKLLAEKFRREDSETHISGINIIISKSPNSLLQEEMKLDRLIPEMKGKNLSLKNCLRDFVIDIERVKKQIHEPMKRATLPKVVTLRIINAIALYNEGIQDEFLFSNFLELRSYIEVLLNNIVSKISERDDSYLSTSNYLNTAVDIFEKAWRNRFHATWRLGEITDFNLDFKGGIQQIVTALDGAYKALTSILGKPGAIAVVAGSPRISSTEMSIELNYFDIFQPEFFAARSSHEAACHKYEEISSLITSPVRDDLIVEEISHLRRALPEYTEWFDPITTPFSPKLFFKILADMCALKFTFFNDIDLFMFWYRNIFIVDPIAWKIQNGKSTSKDEGLMDFLVRLFLVLGDSYDTTNIISNYWSKDVLPELNIDQKAIEEFHTVIKEVLSNSKLFRSLLNNFTHYISDLALKINFNISKAKEYVVQMESDLNSGRVCRYNIENHKPDESRFMFVQSLFNAYLSLLKKKSGVGNVLLERDKNGEPIFSPEKDAKILFDKRGGTFIFDHDLMSWYFRVRCAFIMSLWDMSTKEKYFIPELKKILEKE